LGFEGLLHDFLQMNEHYYKVLRAKSIESLHDLVSIAESQGWNPVGNIDLLDGEYVQPIKFSDYEDDTTEIITIRNDSIDE